LEAREANSFSTGVGKGSGEGCGAGCWAHAGQRNATAPSAINNLRLFIFDSPFLSFALRAHCGS
jgi:hypothetical protein